MEKFIKFSNIFIIVFLPIASLCLSLNLVVRMPDVYQYVFKSDRQLAQLSLSVSDDEVGALISDFMFGKQVDWNIKAGEEPEEKISIFNQAEINYLKDIRLRLNITLAIGVVSLLIFILTVWRLKKREEGELIRKALKNASIVYLFIVAVLIVFFIVNSFSNFSIWINKFDHMVVSEEFYTIFTLTMLKYLYWMWIFASIIFMVVGVYAVLKLTQPKRIFSRGNY